MKRHSTDLVSLAFGILFAAIAAWWLIGRYVIHVNLNVPNLGLFIAAALIVFGLLGVVGSLRRDRRHERPSPAGATDNARGDSVANPTMPAEARPTEPILGDPATMPTVISNPYLAESGTAAPPDDGLRGDGLAEDGLAGEGSASDEQADEDADTVVAPERYIDTPGWTAGAEQPVGPGDEASTAVHPPADPTVSADPDDEPAGPSERDTRPS